MTRTQLQIPGHAALEVWFAHGRWWTPQVYADAWKIGQSAEGAKTAMKDVLVPAMARFCGVPESCVDFHTSDSRIFPGRRFIFWLTATRPVLKAPKVESEAIDI